MNLSLRVLEVLSGGAQDDDSRQTPALGLSLLRRLSPARILMLDMI